MTSPSKDAALAMRPNYRDELNFAEFPLASLSTALPKGQKTLEFEDEIFDKSANQRVKRKLTITASDKYGLPTATDEEVIVGLIQLSAKTDFSDRKVHFTRYELLKLLGWADSTRNYQRLEQSLNRWLGVTLYYEKAWWSKEEQSWVNEGFHILENVQVLDQERQRRSLSKDSPQAGKSSFVWNDVVYSSFKAGYIKQLDFPFLRSLESAISKRIYRFLDKRFYMRDNLTFDLRRFACEHIGLSKNCHNGELKRVLRPALKELEDRGFLKPLSEEARFKQESRGLWSVVLSPAGKAAPKIEAPTSALAKALIERGVSYASAQKLVSHYAATAIEEKIALVDWLAAKKDSRVQRNLPGFLYKAIADSYPLPDDYTASMKAKQKTQHALPPRRISVAARPPEPVKSRAGIDEYWNTLPAEERERLEVEIVAQAPKFLRQQYAQGQKERGILFLTVRQAIIDDHVRRVLGAEGEGTT